jgi:hypothetical protein
MVRVMNTRMFLALFLLGFATNAPAIFEDGLPPTPDEAHGFLGGTFQRYAVAYAGNHGRAGRATAYGGDGCVSELASGRQKRAVTVDWSAVSEVAQLEGNAVDLRGAGAHGNVRLYFPNERAARSSAHAFEVLRVACEPPALTARY